MDYTFPEKFHKAAEVFDCLIGDLQSNGTLDNEHKLMFYALRQQAEKGPCLEPAPSVWRFVERHKHSAWCKLNKMSSFEAMVHFVRCAEASLFPGEVDVNWRDKHQTVVVQASPSRGHGDVAECLSSSAHLISGELVEDRALWDADLRAHQELTEENMIYLASQVMHARRQCEALHASSARAEVHGTVATTTSTTLPPPPPPTTRQAPMRVKGPVHRASGSVTVPPPGVVNASTWASSVPESSAENSPPPPSPQPSGPSWMDWFGW